MIHRLASLLRLRAVSRQPSAVSSAHPPGAKKPGAYSLKPRAKVRSVITRLVGLAFLAASTAFAIMCLHASQRAVLVAPKPTLLVTDRHGEFLAEIPGQPEGELGYWRVDQPPPRVAAATLALEDTRFDRHQGVDVVAVGRAVVQNLTAGEVVSGASTLAMQVARMQTPADRTLWNKGVESLTALLLTQRYGREAILSHYLRLAPYGNRIHGMDYAARRYLDKPVADLSWAEIAFLCAMPQAPSLTNPYDRKGRERGRRRGARILDELAAAGLLDEVELAQAHEQLQSIEVPRRKARPEEAMHAILRLDRALDAPEWREVLEEDPRVRASLDLDLQRKAQAHARDLVREHEARGAGNAAVVVIDRQSGEVLSWVGSTGYFDTSRAGAMDFTAVQRYPGSALKPFVYAQALERGTIRPDSVLDDLHRGPEGITNYDERFLGPLIPRVALANSRNVPAVKLLQKVGIHESYQLYRDLGLHHDELPAQHYGLGLAIGGLPISLEQLVTAYTTLSTDGRLRELSWVEGVPGEVGPRVFDEDTARLLSLWLSDPMARLPSFSRMGHGELPFPVALKTGTSQEWRDAWTVAWSDRVLVAAWVGHPDYRPMAKLPGGDVAADLCRRVLLDVHEDQAQGLADLDFRPPEGWEDYPLCVDTGGLDDGDCERVVSEYMPPGTEPVPDTAHVRMAVDARTGLLAHLGTPREYVVERTFADLGPQYAGWQARQGPAMLPRSVSDGVWPAERPGDGRWAMGDGRPPNSVAEGFTPSADHEIAWSIVSPVDGSRVLIDPEAPPGWSTLPLRVVVEPEVEQVVWYVDGEPWKVVDFPYEARWPIEEGRHTFEVRTVWGGEVSEVVGVWGE